MVLIIGRYKTEIPCLTEKDRGSGYFDRTYEGYFLREDGKEELLPMNFERGISEDEVFPIVDRMKNVRCELYQGTAMFAEWERDDEGSLDQIVYTTYSPFLPVDKLVLNDAVRVRTAHQFMQAAQQEDYEMAEKD